jgi:hypothetical protein
MSAHRRPGKALVTSHNARPATLRAGTMPGQTGRRMVNAPFVTTRPLQSIVTGIAPAPDDDQSPGVRTDRP